MRLQFLPIFAMIFWPAAAGAAVIPDCAGPVVAAQAVVTRVDRDGSLILEHGRAAMLEGIRLPLRDDGAPMLLADQVLVALSGLVRTTSVTLAVTPPARDRYDRLRAQAFAGVWLQRVLLERGLARVMIAPDRSDCAPDLYEAEDVARKAGRGLWALPAYRVRTADAALKGDAGSFQIVQGQVINIGGGSGRTFLDFAADWRLGFSAVIAGEDRKTFRRAGFDLEALRGRRIRLRGMVEMFAGHPEIALSNPAQIEVLD